MNDDNNNDIEMLDYLFDLHGYVILRGAAEPNLVADLNRALDEFPALEFKQWRGNVQRLVKVPLDGAATGLRLVPEATWGAQGARVFAFEPVQSLGAAIPVVIQGAPLNKESPQQATGYLNGRSVTFVVKWKSQRA